MANEEIVKPKKKKGKLIAILSVVIIVATVFCLYSFTTVFDSFLGKKYEITFIVDGKETTQKVSYGTVPIFEGNLTKEPTATVEYVFDCWEPELKKVDGKATYTAKFKEIERLYTVQVNMNHVGAAEISGTGKLYPYNSSATIKIESVKAGYIFEGFYSGETLISTDTTITISNIKIDKVITAKFGLEEYTITYNNVESAQNDNPTKYDVTDGVFKLKNLNRSGYVFKGWFTAAGSTGEKVESIDSSELKNIVLYARWEILQYSITYDLRGGSVAASNPTEYNIETDNFTLTNPTKTGAEFLGWIGTGLTEPTETVVVSKGSYGDRIYTAVWVGDERTINLNIDGKSVTSFDMTLGETLTKEAIDTNFDSADFGMTGYIVKKWFTNEECTNEYNYNTVIMDGNITLYGKYEYLVGGIYFYPYIEEFDQRVEEGTVIINSFEELVAYIDYVKFYNITKKVWLKLAYSYDSISEELETAANSRNSIEDTFFNGAAVSYGYAGDFGYYYLTTNYFEGEASLTADSDKSEICEQQEHSVYQQNKSPRANDFDDFKINKIEKEISVSTSEQLVHVLQSGYKPKPVAGSAAESVYNKAKIVLREICNDTMTDFEKIRAIYEWLVMNVEYDNAALELYGTIPSSELKKYDAWYAEGVFNNGVAVCEGFAKAFNILAKIENIPSIYVAGDGHAWNRVFYEGKWYGVDATHGSPTVNFSPNKYEILTYTNFMFTDAYKTTNGYTADNFSEFAAETGSAFNVYAMMDYTVGTDSFDMFINEAGELEAVFKYVKKYIADNSSNIDDVYVTFEIAMSPGVNIAQKVAEANSAAGTSVQITYDEIDSIGNYVYSLRIAV